MPIASISRARLQATLACGGALLLWWRFGGVLTAAIGGLLAALALLAWCSPSHYAPVQRVFDFLTHVLVTGFSWLLLALVYFGLFAPVRLIGALMGRDPLHLKPARTGLTYLRPLPPALPGRFDRQF